MSSLLRNPPGSAMAPCVPPQVSNIAGWTLREYESVSCTNLVAAELGAWEAVRADVQTAGRGRFQRSWISDAGGLWLSAVVPIQFDKPGSRALPLAVGLAVCDVLRALGIEGLRLRWPNDVLANDRKLAGLLIDQFTPNLAVVGIGINVRNRPEARDASLKNQVARVMDFVPEHPTLSELAGLILRGLRPVVTEMQAANFPALLPRVNELWDPPRRVELDLDGLLRDGMFTGVDETGRLLLRDETGHATAFEPWQVRHLKEI